MNNLTNFNKENQNVERKENKDMNNNNVENANNGQRGIKFVTDKVFLHHPHLCRPYAYKDSIPPRYSVAVVIPKEETDKINKLNSAIAEATALGVKKFGNAISNPTSPHLPIRDGDDGTTGDLAYVNSFYFTVSSQIRPGIVNKKCENEFHDNDYYELRYARVSINLIPYKMDGRLGISFRLNHIQVFPERFDASQNMSSPQEDFA